MSEQQEGSVAPPYPSDTWVETINRRLYRITGHATDSEGALIYLVTQQGGYEDRQWIYHVTVQLARLPDGTVVNRVT